MTPLQARRRLIWHGVFVFVLSLPLEAMNNNVKAVSHRAHGYRTVDTYITAIWHGLGDLPLEPV